MACATGCCGTADRALGTGSRRRYSHAAVAGFLTDDWFADLERAAGTAAVPAELALVVQQVITDGSHEVAYALELAEGSVHVRRGRTAAPDVTFTQDRATATAVHDGELSAQAAFLDGRLRLSGDVAALLAAAPALATLDDVFARCRA